MFRFGGVEGRDAFSLLSLSSLSGSLDGIMMGGVGLPELVDGELSVHIRSLSLSDSSFVRLLCLPNAGAVNETESGLWIRLSAQKVGDLGSNDGRRKRRKSGLKAASSGEDVAVGLRGRANSWEDEGKEWRGGGECDMAARSPRSRVGYKSCRTTIAVNYDLKRPCRIHRGVYHPKLH